MTTSTNGSVRKRYPAYKKVPLGWLHETPEHWSVLRLKDSVRKCVNGVWGEEPNGDDDDIVCIRVADFDRVSFRVANVEFTKRAIPQHQRLSRTVDKGDLLLEKSGGGEVQPVGAVVLFDLEIPAVCSNFIARIQLNPGFDSSFLCYLHATLYSGRLNVRSIKQSIGIQNLDASSYFNEPVSYAPLDEQRCIADFLDRKTAKIDALIAKKKRLIELLQEKRTALISHAVTKGIDASVPMKDSGVEWASRIPCSWSVRRNVLIFAERDERGYPDLPILEVSIRTGVTERQFSDEHIEQQAEDPATYKRAKKGNLAFNKMRMWQGAVGVVPVDGLVSPDYTVAKPRERVCTRYFEYLFRTSFYMTEVNRYSHGIVRDRNRLYWDQFKEMPSLFPPLDEQERIVAHIDLANAKIDALVSKVQEAIEKLREYRAALISAAVTGKIDVLEEAI